MRAEREATVVKEMGNEQFQRGNYRQAVEYYTTVRRGGQERGRGEDEGGAQSTKLR